MKCQTIFYINKDDPRIFVYKHQKYKWFGVTLNFAHKKSFILLFITLGSGILGASLIPFRVDKQNALLYLIITGIYYMGWLIVICYYYFANAKKDLIKHPGKLSNRL